MMDDSARRRNIDNHIKLAETIYHMFKSKDKQVIQWNDVNQSLKDSNMSGQFVEERVYK